MTDTRTSPPPRAMETARLDAIRSLKHLRDHSDEYNADKVAAVCNRALDVLRAAASPASRAKENADER